MFCFSVVRVHERQFKLGILRCRVGGENHDFHHRLLVARNSECGTSSVLYFCHDSA
jgi:hypothetical protein